MNNIEPKYSAIVDTMQRYGLVCREINGYLEFGRKKGNSVFWLGDAYKTNTNFLFRFHHCIKFYGVEDYEEVLKNLVPDYRKKFIAYEKQMISKEGLHNG